MPAICLQVKFPDQYITGESLSPNHWRHDGSHGCMSRGDQDDDCVPNPFHDDNDGG